MKVEETLQEVHQALFGVKDSDDRGVAGDIKDIKKLLEVQNGYVREHTTTIAKNTNSIKWLWRIGGVLVFGGSITISILCSTGIVHFGL